MFSKWETTWFLSAGNLQLIHCMRGIKSKLNVLLTWDMEEMKNGVNFQMKKFQLSVISFSRYKCSHAKNQSLNLTRKIKNKVMGLDKSNQFQYRDHFCLKKRLIHLLSKKY